MKFDHKIKTKLASLLVKCAKRIAPEHLHNLHFAGHPITIIDFPVVRKTVDTVVVQAKFKKYPDDNINELQDRYMRPIIAQQLADELVKSGYVQIELTGDYNEFICEGKLHVVKI